MLALILSAFIMQHRFSIFFGFYDRGGPVGGECVRILYFTIFWFCCQCATQFSAPNETQFEVAVGAKLPQDWLRGSLWDAKSKARCSSMLCLPINGLRWSVSLLLIRQSDNVVNSTSDEVG